MVKSQLLGVCVCVYLTVSTSHGAESPCCKSTDETSC